MSVTVRVPTILRTHTGGASEVPVDGVATLAELLDKLAGRPPALRIEGEAGEMIVDEAARDRAFVGDDDVRFADGLQTATPDGTTVSIIPAVAGG